MVYNEVYGTCPFRFINDTEPYAIPAQDSLIDPKLQQLLQARAHPPPHPPFDTLRLQQDYVIKSQGSLTEPKLQQLLRRSLDTLRFQQDNVIRSLLDAKRLVHVIMGYGDPTFLPPVLPADCHLMMWNILRQYGSGPMRSQDVQRFALTLLPSPCAKCCNV